MGVLVGDALGFGMQWYYDTKAKDKDFGPWVTDYVDPKPDGEHFFAYVSKYRYEQGLRAGDISQLAQLYAELLASVVEMGSFDRTAFYKRVDTFMAPLNGESLCGHYTDGIIIDVRKKRLDGMSWEDPQMASEQITGDGAVLSVVLAAIYTDPKELAEAANHLMAPLIGDSFIRQNSIVFALTVQALINGTSIEDLGDTIKKMASVPEIRKLGGSFDNFLTPGVGKAAFDPAFASLEPKLVAQLFGPDCSFIKLAPAAYFLAHRLPNDFEAAVLSASNSAGQNVVRAAMTGALSGAMNGIEGVPKRFLEKLQGGSEMLSNAKQIAALTK